MLVLPLALRMELLVALLAHADELPLPGLRIPDAQCQVRPILQVLDVVYNHCAAESSGRFASLAFVPVEAKDFSPACAPFTPAIKAPFLAVLQQSYKFSQPQRRNVVRICFFHITSISGFFKPVKITATAPASAFSWLPPIGSPIPQFAGFILTRTNTANSASVIITDTQRVWRPAPGLNRIRARPCMPYTPFGV